ncbi:hypothetical protein [Moraxella catarrhalis]|uniref:hypothetical protein n=1 Tax=Moraxella catarrhalis TaxID=480 RepID=UPI00128D3033|nr:hypothetical protein [Moraxella catarrhalis]MPX08002.1 hypothetical protein [Moraxella catarrhalis]
MNIAKIDALISNFSDAIAMLSELKDELTEPKPVILQEPSASTTEVYLRTEVLYPWVKLRSCMSQYLYGIFIYFIVNISTLVLTLCTKTLLYTYTSHWFVKYKGEI